MARKTKRPKGERFENLYRLPSGIIKFDSDRKGVRTTFSCGTRNWEEAAEYAEGKLEKLGKRARLPDGRMPTFGEMAARYLAEDISHLSASARRGPQGKRRN